MPRVTSPSGYAQSSKVGQEGQDNISRDEALQMLGVKKETLYTYVSRGWIRSFPLTGGRTRVFSRVDTERLRSRSLVKSGIEAVARTAMLYGEPIITTRITEMTEQGPSYRGKLSTDLATRGSSIETVALWLWTEEWLDDQAPWEAASDFRPTLSDSLHECKDSVEFIKSLAKIVLELGTGVPAQSRLDDILNSARRIMQTLVGMLGILSAARSYTPRLENETLAATVARALGVGHDKEAVPTLNAMMVLCAEYELAPASFTARVVTSAGGDLFASVAAGLCAHSGLLSGPTCDKLAEILSGCVRGQSLQSSLKEIQDLGTTKFGFNHTLATKGDPRADWMIERAKMLISRKPSPTTQQILHVLQIVREDFGLYPGLPAGLVALTAALRLPPRSAAAIWAIARTIGQIAHVIEQRDVGSTLRPRAQFVAH